jgi:hypothetical protein
MAMTNTTISETVARRMADNGFKRAQIDGDFRVWRRPTDDGTELRICTTDYELDGDPGAKQWLVSRHSDSDSSVACDEAMTLVRAAAVAELIPSPLTHDTDSHTTMTIAEIEGPA